MNIPKLRRVLWTPAIWVTNYKCHCKNNKNKLRSIFDVDEVDVSVEKLLFDKLNEMLKMLQPEFSNILRKEHWKMIRL